MESDIILRLIAILEKDREKPEVSYIDIGKLLKELKKTMTVTKIAKRMQELLGKSWDITKVARVIRCGEQNIPSITKVRYEEKARKAGYSSISALKKDTQNTPSKIFSETSHENIAITELRRFDEKLDSMIRFKMEKRKIDFQHLRHNIITKMTRWEG